MTAFNKTWLGTSSTDPATAANWQAISVRNSAYSWTASGSGTNEYYLRTSGSADPGIPEKPGQVIIGGAVATEGTIGSLTAGQWAFGDNDTLGYSTIYVRLSDGADPDSKARDHVTFKAIPYAGDPIRISAEATRGLAGYDLSSRATGTFVIEPGFKDLAIGSQESPLRIATSAFTCEGSGGQRYYIDLGSAAITAEVRDTPRASSGRRGLYLTGSALTAINVLGGSVALAGLGETSTVTTANVAGNGDLLLGTGVTVTEVNQKSGSSLICCNATTVNMDGGTMVTDDAAAFTTLNVRGGQCIDNSSGNHGTVNLEAGTLDTLQDQAAKTYTTFKHNAGTFRENVSRLTITTRSEPDYDGTVQRSRAA